MSQFTAVFLILLALAAVSFFGERSWSGRCCVDPSHRATKDFEIDYCPASEGRTLPVTARHR
jgi:hypothetical protein